VPFLERLLANIVLVAVVLFTQRDCEVVAGFRADPAVRSAPNMSGLDFPPHPVGSFSTQAQL